MKLVVDPDAFMLQQEIFAGELIARIADLLQDAGTPSDKLKDLTGKIAFEVTSMLDDVSGIEFDGIEANPYLTFLHGDQIVHLGGNSTTHEMVFGILNAMFQESD